MKSIVKALSMGAGLAVLLAGLTTTAQAAPLVFVSPSAQVVNSSIAAEVDAIYVDIVAQDIGQALGGFDLDISWNDALLDAVTADVVFDPGGYWSGDSSFTVQGASSMSLFFSGNPSGVTSPIILATVKFTSFLGAQGNSNIDLSNVTLSDDALPDANDIDPKSYSVQGGVVCLARLGEPQVLPDPECQRSVPEPAMMSLLGVGLATLAARRRASKRS